MTIKGISSAFDSVVDINNGQYTETFEQAGDAEYDVDVSASGSIDQAPISDSGSGTANSSIDYTGVVVTIFNLSGESVPLDYDVDITDDTSDSYVSIYVNGNDKGLSASGTNESVSSITIRDQSDSVGLSADYSYSWQMNLTTSASTTVNSITQQ